MRDPQDVNCYVNFVLYAVTGLMGEADDLMLKFGDRVRRVAAHLAERQPIARAPRMPRPIFRGVLVDPAKPLERCDRRRFVSWSEDRDVACWFASRESSVSEYVVASDARLRGVVLELATPSRVLFHHSWASERWGEMAAMHPHMGVEGARQFVWSLRTQREVITDQLALPPATPLEQIPHPPIAELNRRLTPPWTT